MAAEEGAKQPSEAAGGEQGYGGHIICTMGTRLAESQLKDSQLPESMQLQESPVSGDDTTIMSVAAATTRCRSSHCGSADMNAAGTHT